MNASAPNARLQYESALKYKAYRMPTNEEWATAYDELKSSIDRLESELVLARSDADSAIANCDGWREKCDDANEEIKSLERERDGLRNALKTNPCCRPVSGASITDGYHYVTVEDCVASGNCGCDCGAALRSPEEQKVAS